MARLGRPGMTDAQKDEVWRRWRNGESLSDIGRAVSKFPASIFGLLRLHGGFTPPGHQRAVRALTLAEREEISRGLAAGSSLRQIARALNRAPSTISREVSRNTHQRSYRATRADENAWDRARRPKLCRLALNGRLRYIVASKLALDWSPEQIAGWLKRTYPDDASLQVSHETIYRSLFVQTRGVLKKALKQHLRTRRVFRQSRHSNIRGLRRGQLSTGSRLPIDPPRSKTEPSPVIGNATSLPDAAIPTSRLSSSGIPGLRCSVKITGKDTTTVVTALSTQVRKLPEQLRQSLTWDRGMELANHKSFTLATDTQVYFCDPQSPWQRGTNENTNKLLRQYFPKGTDLSVHSQTELNRIAQKLNQRPRKILGYETPADRLQASVASTG